MMTSALQWIKLLISNSSRLALKLTLLLLAELDANGDTETMDHKLQPLQELHSSLLNSATQLQSLKILQLLNGLNVLPMDKTLALLQFQLQLPQLLHLNHLASGLKDKI
jgi:hypothetical protein